MTEYMVFHGVDNGWVFDSTVEAQTSSDAVKKWLRNVNGDSEADLFVAIPSRSWKPMKVTVETTPRVKLTSAID